MPLYIAKSGDLDRCYRCLTDRLTTLKDRATQLLIKYKSGALVTQLKHMKQDFEVSFCFVQNWQKRSIACKTSIQCSELINNHMINTL